MGLLDSMPQGAPQQGGLLDGMAPQGGSQMPPEMMEMVQKIKQMDPAMQQQVLQQLIQKIQTSGKPPAEAQQAIQQLTQAVGAQ